MNESGIGKGGATEIGEDQVHPAAIVPVTEIGLQKFDKEGFLSVDAARVNPRKPKPFIWTAKASDILEKVKRARRTSRVLV